MDTPTLVQSDVTSRRIFAYQALSKTKIKRGFGDEARGWPLSGGDCTMKQEWPECGGGHISGVRVHCNCMSTHCLVDGLVWSSCF